MASSLPSLDDLVSLIEQHDVEIRFAHLNGRGGGLCISSGKRMFFVDQDADPSTQTEAALQAVGEIDRTRNLYLTPVIREAIERLNSET
ncbi:MAG: hypothetical protein ACYTHJ_10800 [Planctomycetota bacterium]|jgi:hypothetical protein